MRKHTTINLDLDLVQSAQDVLGTPNATETIHRALAEVVTQEKRRRLAERPLPGLTPESLEEMRQSRTLDQVKEL